MSRRARERALFLPFEIYHLEPSRPRFRLERAKTSKHYRPKAKTRVNAQTGRIRNFHTFDTIFAENIIKKTI